MITVSVHLIIRPYKQVEFSQAIEGIGEKIAQEAGCLGCRVYQNIKNADEFLVIQEWKNEESAQEHLNSTNLAVLVGAKSVLSQEVCVQLGKDLSIEELRESFVERIEKKTCS
jgi:quinol monooxygenase YgiN